MAHHESSVGQLSRSGPHGLARGEAYILCSAAMDLKVSEVVDAPNWTVTAYIADSIFPDE